MAKKVRSWLLFFGVITLFCFIGHLIELPMAAKSLDALKWWQVPILIAMLFGSIGAMSNALAKTFADL